MPRKRASHVIQAWVVLLADDPEALSALAVARERLAAARHLTGLRRMRVFELTGPLPELANLEDLLHRSTQFYNPHKERCMVRSGVADPAPVESAERVVLISERGGERRLAAERWWLHETGQVIEVREGVAWALAFEPRADAAACVQELTVLRDRRHGLLSNPYSQEARIAGDRILLPWLTASEASGTKGETG